MEKRVKSFFETDNIDLEHAINNFLENTKGKLHSIHYQYIVTPKDEWYATAMIEYTPEGKDEKKGNKGKEENEKGDGGVQGKTVAFRLLQRAVCKV